MKPIDFKIFETEPDDQYHARSKSGATISSHMLMEFDKSPLLYAQKIAGLIPDRDSGAYVKGRAVHKLTLEGRQEFEAAYAFDFPVNPKTGKSYGRQTKAFEEWQATQDKPVLTADEIDCAEQLAAAIRSHDAAAELLSTGRPEAVVRGKLGGLECQIRIDWYNPERGIVDLKTADDLDYFQTDARKYRYGFQAGFYQLVLAAAAGLDPDEIPVAIIAAEKKAPHRVGVFYLTPDTLRTQRAKVKSAMATLADCRRLNHWPTGYEQPIALDLD